MDTSQPTLSAQETDALLHLEERILRAVELVASLRQEKQTLLAEKTKLLADKDALESDLARQRESADSLQQEIASLRDERKQVKTRIERLLGQMDSLANG
ncbi:MAG: DUF3450 domain-containing protein [Bryobacterales bacterium]|jgi:FtsZ-binding cell division protein ZapB|nr:DUF3450 domain-containing protein [Bryobacterales bacterium]